MSDTSSRPLARPKAPPLRELTLAQRQWILGGAVMTLATMPGQTTFIAQFNTALRETFGLSHGAFGGLYTIATLASATALIFAGSLADRISARRLAIACLAGLALTCVLMSSLWHVAPLVVGLALLRFFGQGMLFHIAMTVMSRWFNRFRGRALSLASLGYTVGEGMLPFAITLAILAMGWRNVWLVTGAVLVLVMVPLVAFLLRDPPDGRRAMAAGRVNPDAMEGGRQTGAGWTRRAVLRDPLFYALIPGIMGPPAIGTLFIFHQAHLNGLKGWDLTTFTAFFPFLSGTVAIMALVSGGLVDRFGAWRLMPVLLLPLGCASLVIATQGWFGIIPVFFVLMGMTTGMMSPVVGALWAELYGTTHLGAIRSLATAALVAASAVGPGLAGWLIDIGFALDLQGYAYAAYCFAGAAAYLALQRAFAARTASIAESAG